MAEPNRDEPTPHDQLLTRPSAEPLPTPLAPAGPEARGFPADPKAAPERNPAPNDIGRSA